MVGMGILVLAGVATVVVWRNAELEVPWERGQDLTAVPVPELIRRYLWLATVGATGGLVAGVTMLGAGGRLVMRLLAVTAGEAAQGRLTEAHEIVGEITLGGTMSFVGFFGILIGTVIGLSYMAVRRWLPRGIWGGLTFGLGLLLIQGTRSDPLRPDNPDFGIVGPGWLAVIAFSLVVIGYGAVVASVASGYGRRLPLIRRDLKTIAKYLPVCVVLGPGVLLIAVPMLLVGALWVMVARTKGLRDVLRSRGVLLAGWVIGIAALAIAAPGFIAGVIDIAGGG